MGLYAKLLDGSLTAGQALAYAKQAYYGSLGAVGVYDIKILQQTDLLRPAVLAGLGHVRPGRYGVAGLDVRDVIPPALPGPLTIDPVTGPPGSWTTRSRPDFAEVDTERPRPLLGRHRPRTATRTPLTTQNRPIQPQTVAQRRRRPRLVAHGALVTSLTSHDVPNVNPVLAALSADQAAAAPEVQATEASWPARMAVVSNFQSPTGLTQDLVLVPGPVPRRHRRHAAPSACSTTSASGCSTPPTPRPTSRRRSIERGKGTGVGSQHRRSPSSSTTARRRLRSRRDQGVRVGFRDFDGVLEVRGPRYAEVPASRATTPGPGTASDEPRRSAPADVVRVVRAGGRRSRQRRDGLGQGARLPGAPARTPRRPTITVRDHRRRPNAERLDRGRVGDGHVHLHRRRVRHRRRRLPGAGARHRPGHDPRPRPRRRPGRQRGQRRRHGQPRRHAARRSARRSRRPAGPTRPSGDGHVHLLEAGSGRRRPPAAPRPSP